ncbi:MAG: SDR family NAD(P)-dependent oxidoreductase [Cyanobacteria bacterium P01_A01_bin.123]
MIILITGASSGIGRKLVLHYLKQEHTVVAIARREHKLKDLRQAVSNPDKLKLFPADVTDKAQMQAAIATIEETVGPLDLVIANAGVTTQHLTPQLDLVAFEQLMNTNVMGSLYTLVPATQAMMPRGHGQVVAISSLAAFHAFPRISTYCATKAALNAQISGLYWSLKPYGIQVTTICPGFVETEMTLGQQVPKVWCLKADKAVEKIVRAIAQKRRLYRFPFWQSQLVGLLNLLPPALNGYLYRTAIEKAFPRPVFSK